MFKRQGILMLISDFLSPIEKFATPFKLAARKFDLIPVLLQDKLEQKIPSLGLCLNVDDPETGEEALLGLSSGEINHALADYQQKHMAQLRALFNPYKIDPIVVNTAQSSADPVIKFFQARAKKVRN